jgi:hypothetical protein
MGIINRERLTAITETKHGNRMFAQIVNEAKLEDKASVTATLFLSHCHDDKAVVDKVVVFLRKSGVKVYIDWLDTSMPPTTSEETANRIKQRIRSCDKFLLLATNNAISSKWCNWELGFGDAHKYINKIALFPLSENSGSWYGNEYLKIYPRIEESNYVADVYKVIFPNAKEMSVGDWLKL